jgi:transposase
MRYATDSSANVGRFGTPDLTLAGFLRCRDFRLRGIEARGDRALFVFSDSPALRRALVDYANDAPVPVHTLCETIRHLKSLSRQILDSRESLEQRTERLTAAFRPGSPRPRAAAWTHG